MRWRDDAVCKGEDITVFFPEDGHYGAALEYCRRCPVARPCLESVLQFDDRRDADGMFGGKTPGERSAIRYRRMLRGR